MLQRIFCSERNMLILIAINAAIITLLYFPLLENNRWLDSIEKGITLLFLVEAVVKLRENGARAYFASGWNRFDLTLILLSIPSLLVDILPVPDTSLLLLLRLLRLVRLIRLFRFVPHIDKLVGGLGRAVKASFLVMAVLAFANFLSAMVSCHLFRNYAPDLFGNPYRAMYTMFQVFTIEGWNSIPDRIAEGMKAAGFVPSLFSSEFVVAATQVYFATTALFGGIFGLSLANAIFVDEMTIDNTNTLEAKIDQLGEQIARLQQTLESRGP